jgi:hypothetical protein
VNHRISWTWIAVFVALIALECYPIWAFPYFPSQDGPSHLYNASVLANYSSQPLYREYYIARITPAGNVLFELSLAGLIKFLSPALVEKLILTGYIVLFSLAFLALLQVVGPNARLFSLFAFVFVANNFFQVGFWSFVYSIPVALLALRYYLRGRAHAAPAWYALLTLWGLVLYETHMASWLVFALALAVFTGFDLLALFLREPRTPMVANTAPALRAALPLATLIVPAVLTLMFMLGSQYRSVTVDRYPEGLAEHVRPLILLSFMRTFTEADLVFSGMFAVLVIGMLLTAAWPRLRQGWILRQWNFRPGDAWLALAVACGLASVLAPNGASGVYIRQRLSLYAWLFLVVWLAAQVWRPSVARWCSACACLLAVLPFFWRMPEYRRWDTLVTEFASVAPNIAPGSTVLAIPMLEPPRRIDSLLHAVDLFTPKPFIDLRNYEAATTYFPTSFRPQLTPFNSLGRIEDLQKVPAIFNVSRYERKTHASVDYVLFYGRETSDTYPERETNAALLSHYKLVCVSQPTALVRVYRRLDTQPTVASEAR